MGKFILLSLLTCKVRADMTSFSTERSRLIKSESSFQLVSLFAFAW